MEDQRKWRLIFFSDQRKKIQEEGDCCFTIEDSCGIYGSHLAKPRKPCTSGYPPDRSTPPLQQALSAWVARHTVGKCGSSSPETPSTRLTEGQHNINKHIKHIVFLSFFTFGINNHQQHTVFLRFVAFRSQQFENAFAVKEFEGV